MKVEVVVAPPVEPISRADVYAWLRLDTVGSPPSHPNDVLIDMLIASAREQVEKDTRRALVEQTIELTVRNFPACLIRPPFIGLVSVRYYDSNNVQQTLDPNVCYVQQSLVPRLALADGQSWPVVFWREDAVTIRYTVGHEGTGSPVEDYTANIPKALKQACLLRVQIAYDNLKPTDEQQREISYKALTDSWRVPVV